MMWCYVVQDSCPYDLVTVMESCLAFNPQDRPTMHKVNEVRSCVVECTRGYLVSQNPWLCIFMSHVALLRICVRIKQNVSNPKILPMSTNHTKLRLMKG